MSKTGLQKHAYRKRLWDRQRGACYWCHRQMLLKRQHVKKPPDNLATFEHLDSRFSPERGKHPWTRRVVLACLKCNNDRARAEERSLPIEELRQRASKGSR